jgi:nitrate reductase beta subunit
VGRIRYLGILLYDQDQMLEIAKLPDDQLVEGQRRMILNPHDPEVIAAALKAGIHESVITAAQNSPVYQFVKEWGIAFPPHVEYRTFPMLFYVPPLLPILGTKNNGIYDSTDSSYFSALDKARLPMKYLAQMFSAGNVELLKGAFKKLIAVRTHRRSVTVKDITPQQSQEALQEAQLTAEMADAIYKLTALPTFEQRFVIPPMHREEALEALKDPLEAKGADGFGFMREPHRGL